MTNYTPRIFGSETEKNEYYNAHMAAFRYSKPAIDQAIKGLRTGLEKYGITGRGLDFVISCIVPSIDWEMTIDEAIESGKLQFSTQEKKDAVVRANAWFQAEIGKIISQYQNVVADRMEQFNG